MGGRPDRGASTARIHGGVTTVYFSSRPVHAVLHRKVQAGVDLASLAGVLRVDRSTLYRVLSRDRLRYDTADRLAIALGCHPCGLWPDWFDVTQSLEGM